ncbi:MAG: hypothetical protein KF819_13960 [Labilithrix sp.]|nr:hypothetical protein [Labilithrix sp.]
MVGRTTAIFALGAIAALACGNTTTSEEAAAPPKAPAAAPVSVAFPPTAIPAGVEKTECVVVRLGNATPLHIGSIRNDLGDGSHHLIVYRTSDTVEKPTPFACDPFTDTLDPEKGSTLMVTQKKEDTLTLPPGVAFSIEANQMVRLEMHYINASASQKTITAKSTFIPISDDDFRDEAGFLFIGNPDIQLPPNTTTTLGPTFFQVPAELWGVKFFAMTGHQHKLGTNVQIAMTPNADDPGRMVYDVPDWSWSEPKTETFDPPFTVPNDGGFTFTCTWNNTTDRQVRFGESANAEMCFFWAYYYPNKGARVCFHTKRIGGQFGTDICCPGDGLCGLILSEGGR